MFDVVYYACYASIALLLVTYTKLGLCQIGVCFSGFVGFCAYLLGSYFLGSCDIVDGEFGVFVVVTIELHCGDVYIEW